VVTPLLLSGLLSAAGGIDPATAFDQGLAAAESSLQRGDVAGAERRYASVLLEGWLLLGTLERIEGRLPQAREAFRAAAAASEDRRAQWALAAAHLQMGEAAEAEALLAPMARSDPADVQTRALLAQALLARGEAAQAALELEAARARAPDDLELAFALGGAYLVLGNVDRAAELFALIVDARPIPQTRLLIGRTYGEAGQFDRARAELLAASKQDPRLRGAHYALGMLALKQGQRAALAEAIDAFRTELKLAPADRLATLELGVALAESQRWAEAGPLLEAAARTGPPHPRTLYYLGRSQLGLDRADNAAASLSRALELAQQGGANAPALRAIRTQLGQALRAAGRAEEAAAQFAESERLSAEGTEAERENLARYLADAPDPAKPRAPAVALAEASPLAELPAARRRAIAARVRTGLARAYLNLGVLRAQSQDFAGAAERFEQAAGLDPALPRLQYSLGVAYFNAGQFERATGPLSRALAEQPKEAGLRSMLAMAWLNSSQFAQAADLLRDDPERPGNAALQFAYGLALVRSERASEAEPVFATLLREHGDSPELSVMIGQAHAQQGDYPSAIEALERALRLRPDVAEANGTLGVIYLRQGKLEAAEKALQEELRAHPTDASSQQNLAIVLESLQRLPEAVEVLRRLLAARPELNDARYLLGKTLLAQGASAEAVQHLEAAAKAAPKDPNIRYQLGTAYQRTGRPELAQREFEEFRRLKDAQRN
jgi:tetratricopeptide (TPR) repeat protein